MAHTPGPWIADAISENGDVRIACVEIPLVIASAHNGASIGEILAGLSPEIQWANARLISAAPELLAAAEEVYALSLVIESAVRNSDSRNHARILAALRVIRAAIVKAEAV